MKGTGERAENDLEQRCSEGGSASVEKARESKPRNPDHVMADGTKPKHQLQQTQSSAGRIGGPASGKVRSQNHVHMKTEARAKTAEASGLGAGRFEGYNLGYTSGSNTDADNHAIKRAATDQEVHKAKSRLQKKRAVAKVLNIDTKCHSYINKKGVFKQQWDKFLPPTPK
jgi:hypothetical protein